MLANAYRIWEWSMAIKVAKFKDVASGTQNGQFTVGHDASAATDRTFHYELRRRG